MGTSREEWVIYGQRYPYSQKLSDKVDNIDQYSDNDDDFVALVDGMNGEYIIIGKVIEEGDEYEGIELSGHTIEDLEEYKQEVVPKIAQLGIENWADVPFKIYFLSHWH